jgi:hypothetical protein
VAWLLPGIIFVSAVLLKSLISLKMADIKKMTAYRG